MRTPIPTMMLAAALLASGCSGPENAGLTSVHQPVVSPTRDGKSTAAVPGCPDWSRASHPESSSTMSNYGCATNSNLAAMIADPMDLVKPRAAAGTDPYVAAKAVRSWRDTPSSGQKALEKISTKGGQ